MIIDDYFNSIERSLSNTSHVTHIGAPFQCLASDDYNGLLQCRVFFWDESYLDIYEVVSTELGYPVRVHYAYTYMRQGQHVFRYDNAPHHRHIPTFPNHKHLGIDEHPAPSDQPSLHQVLAEIASWLEM
jgi:hypothetical protein